MKIFNGIDFLIPSFFVFFYKFYAKKRGFYPNVEKNDPLKTFRDQLGMMHINAVQFLSIYNGFQRGSDHLGQHGKW